MIEPEDYIVQPLGQLGEKTLVSQYEGSHYETFTEMDDALAHIWQRMDAERFWPSVWWVSDHGNAWMIDKNGHEIKESEQ